MSADTADHKTAIARAFDAWWRGLTRQGDPQRRTRLTEEAFEMGYNVALALNPPHSALERQTMDPEVLRERVTKLVCCGEHKGCLLEGCDGGCIAMTHHGNSKTVNALLALIGVRSISTPPQAKQPDDADNWCPGV